jgi:hypothetical protein
MFRSVKLISLMAGVLIATVSVAQPPAGAPAGSTGVCRDGSYWSGATKKGACRGHKGVQDWYGGTDASSGSAAVSTAASAGAPAAAAAAAAAPVAAAPAAPAAAPKAAAAPATAPAPGGGPGMVWVNTSSQVYHCPADKWYGKTKNGAYMSEADAIAKGNHADHGKACK